MLIAAILLSSALATPATPALAQFVGVHPKDAIYMKTPVWQVHQTEWGCYGILTDGDDVLIVNDNTDMGHIAFQVTSNRWNFNGETTFPAILGIGKVGMYDVTGLKTGRTINGTKTSGIRIEMNMGPGPRMDLLEAMAKSDGLAIVDKQAKTILYKIDFVSEQSSMMLSINNCAE